MTISNQRKIAYNPRMHEITHLEDIFTNPSYSGLLICGNSRQVEKTRHVSGYPTWHALWFNPLSQHTGMLSWSLRRPEDQQWRHNVAHLFSHSGVVNIHHNYCSYKACITRWPVMFVGCKLIIRSNYIVRCIHYMNIYIYTHEFKSILRGHHLVWNWMVFSFNFAKHHQLATLNLGHLHMLLLLMMMMMMRGGWWWWGWG